MKKYILKIGGLTATTTALVTTIACSSKAKPVNIKKVNLESLLIKFTRIQSSKTKAEITTILKNKNTKKCSFRWNNLKKDWIYPPFSKIGVTTTYNLEQTWTTSSTKLKIKVTLKKSGQDSKSKTIIITPKVINFTTEKAKFVNQKSDKTKTEISSVLKGKLANTQLSDDNLRKIGFKLPDAFDTIFKPIYTLEESWTDASTKVRVKVTLEKRGEKDTKEITITPLVIDFSSELGKFFDKISSKTKGEINVALKDKGKKDELLDDTTISAIGYNPPEISGFNVAYKLKEDWTPTSTKVKIEVTLTKQLMSATKEITITPLEIALDTQLAEFQNKVDSLKTKGEINVALENKDKKDEPLDDTTISAIGYNPPEISGFNVTYKLKEDWTSTSTEVKIQVTLTKQLMTATKVITITPMTIDFTTELAKFDNKISSKTKGEINVALENKDKENEPLDDTTISAIGYNPLEISGFNVTYKLKEDWTSTSTQVKIEVTLTKQLMSATKEITVTPTTIDFTTELAKFDNKISSKTKQQINVALENKDKKDEPLDDTTISAIGYNPPEISGFNVTYKLKEDWTSTSTQVKIEVTLTKQLMLATKVITITPMTIDFTTELAKFDNKISSKTKGEITNAIKNKSLGDITIADVGYTPPEILNPEFVATYEITEKKLADADDEHSVTIQVTLTKQLMSATKEITITPETIDFVTELAKFFHKISSKTKGEINKAIENKLIGEITIVDVGYTPATFDPTFTAKYEIIKVPSGSETTFTIKVTLEKRLEQDNKDIEITPLVIDFSSELAKFEVRTSSSKTKKEIIEALASVPNTATAIGLTTLEVLDRTFTYSYKLLDALSKLIKIEVTLEKRGDKNTKEITITPHAVDFSGEKSKYTDKYTTKDNEDLRIALQGKKKNDLLTQTDLQKIGYTPPTLADLFVAKYKLAEPWVGGTSTMVKIEVALQNVVMNLHPNL